MRREAKCLVQKKKKKCESSLQNLPNLTGFIKLGRVEKGGRKGGGSSQIKRITKGSRGILNSSVHI